MPFNPEEIEIIEDCIDELDELGDRYSEYTLFDEFSNLVKERRGEFAKKLSYDYDFADYIRSSEIWDKMTEGEKLLFELKEKGALRMISVDAGKREAKISEYAVDEERAQDVYQNYLRGKMKDYKDLQSFRNYTAEFEKKMTSWEFYGKADRDRYPLFGEVKLKGETTEKLLYEFSKKLDVSYAMDRINELCKTDASQMSKGIKISGRDEVYAHLETTVTSHARRGFWNMVFHPVDYYREYKAIEQAKSRLVDLDCNKEKVDAFEAKIIAATQNAEKNGKYSAADMLEVAEAREAFDLEEEITVEDNFVNEKDVALVKDEDESVYENEPEKSYTKDLEDSFEI